MKLNFRKGSLIFLFILVISIVLITYSERFVPIYIIHIITILLMLIAEKNNFLKRSNKYLTQEKMSIFSWDLLLNSYFAAVFFTLIAGRSSSSIAYGVGFSAYFLSIHIITSSSILLIAKKMKN